MWDEGPGGPAGTQGAPVMSPCSHGTSGVPGKQEADTKRRRVSVADSLVLTRCCLSLLLRVQTLINICLLSLGRNNSTFCLGRAGTGARRPPGARKGQIG